MKIQQSAARFQRQPSSTARGRAMEPRSRVAVEYDDNEPKSRGNTKTLEETFYSFSMASTPR